MRWWTLALAAIVTLPAQPSSADCRRKCKDGESRNARGCCVAKAKTVKKRRLGSIKIDSTAFAAEIYIDGRAHGDTAPTIIRKLQPGTYEIEVRKGERSWKGTVRVRAGKRTRVDAKLVKEQDRWRTELHELCEGGDANSCIGLAQLLFTNDKNADLPAATTYARKGCGLADRRSCFYLKQICVTSPCKEIDRARKEAAVDCKKGDMERCLHQGLLYKSRDSKTPAEIDRAKDALGKACDADIGRACYERAEVLVEAKKYDEMLEPYEKACRLDTEIACGRLGYYYRVGKYDLPKNATKSKEYRLRVCQLAAKRSGRTPKCDRFK